MLVALADLSRGALVAEPCFGTEPKQTRDRPRHRSIRVGRGGYSNRPIVDEKVVVPSIRTRARRANP
jgi:hypothetical protein